MAVTLKLLGNGTVGSGAGTDLYIASTSPKKTAALKAVSFVNTNTTTSATIDLYVYRSGDANRRLIPASTVIPPGGQIIHEDEITLGSGDKIVGIVASGNTVDFVVCGLERDV